MSGHSGTEEFEFFASCLAGAEKLLAAELKGLGARRVRPLGGGAAFFGGAPTAERICLWSRVASRVMLVVGRANAGDAELLYAGVYDMPWERIVAPGASISVRANGTNQELRNTKFTALKVKDALCDRLRARRGERPEVNPHNPDVLLEVRVRESRATVSLDLSGESLHKRAYFDQHDSDNAPLSCAYACSTLALAGWFDATGAQAARTFFDPVCEDGIMLVEATAAACDMAPGLLRTSWGFFAWCAHDDDAWTALLDDADARFEAGLARYAVENPQKARFVGTSASSPSVARARVHVKRAGLRDAASVEYSESSEAGRVAARVAALRAAAADAGDATAGCEEGHLQDAARADMLVACAFATERESFDARFVSEAASFVAAASAVGEGARFASCAGEGMQARFGHTPCEEALFGKGRIEVPACVFSQPPAQAQTILVPDAHGGAEHRVEVHDAASEQFASRLRKTAKERRKWARRQNVQCYRVYDADLPEYAAAIDVYEGAGEQAGKTFVHVAEYQAPSSVDAVKAQRRFEDVLAIVPAALGVRPEHVFSKVRSRAKGGSQYRDAGRRSYVAHTVEDEYLFEVDFGGYLDTGLFLDHRTTRLLVGERAAGKRFLNLFAYTGSATVHAAGGGAAETVTVDLSQTYLDWARRNMQLNGFSGARHAYERADVMEWITAARRANRRFDLVFVDPPTFSNSKAMGTRTWDVQRDHVELLIGVTRLLSAEGEAVFSCNLRTFKPDVAALEKYGVTLEDITASTIPHDFERNPRIHKCYLVRRA